MNFTVLGSGSKGNAVLVEWHDTAILIDAGFSGKQIAERMAKVGKDINSVNAIFVTHEHNDHIAGVGILARRLEIPVFANEGTFQGGEKKLGKLPKRKEFETGDLLCFQDLQIRSFPISHDTNDPVGYLISNGRDQLGYLTDTGTVTHLMAARLQRCAALILEFNHDPHMLRTGPYPPILQQRVRSSQGHLANEDAAVFLRELQSSILKTVVLAHLSEKNNLPELALRQAREALGASSCRLLVASQSHPLPMQQVDGDDDSVTPMEEDTLMNYSAVVHEVEYEDRS